MPLLEIVNDSELIYYAMESTEKFPIWGYLYNKIRCVDSCHNIKSSTQQTSTDEQITYSSIQIESSCSTGISANSMTTASDQTSCSPSPNMVYFYDVSTQDKSIQCNPSSLTIQTKSLNIDVNEPKNSSECIQRISFPQMKFSSNSNLTLASEDEIEKTLITTCKAAENLVNQVSNFETIMTAQLKLPRNQNLAKEIINWQNEVTTYLSDKLSSISPAVDLTKNADIKSSSPKKVHFENTPAYDILRAGGDQALQGSKEKPERKKYKHVIQRESVGDSKATYVRRKVVRKSFKTRNENRKLEPEKEDLEANNSVLPPSVHTKVENWLRKIPTFNVVRELSCRISQQTPNSIEVSESLECGSTSSSYLITDSVDLQNDASPSETETLVSEEFSQSETLKCCTGYNVVYAISECSLIL